MSQYKQVFGVKNAPTFQESVERNLLNAYGYAVITVERADPGGENMISVNSAGLSEAQLKRLLRDALICLEANSSTVLPN